MDEGAVKPGQFHNNAPVDGRGELKHDHVVFETEESTRIVYTAHRYFGLMPLVNYAFLSTALARRRNVAFWRDSAIPEAAANGNNDIADAEHQRVAIRKLRAHVHRHFDGASNFRNRRSRFNCHSRFIASRRVACRST
jgi:hypothetical protein